MAKDIDEFGISGNDIEQIYGYKVIVVGGSPNLMPSVRVEETGIETNVYKVSKNQGTMDLKSAHSNFSQIDTGASHVGGDFSVTCANQFSVRSGAGGIKLVTNGNTNIYSGGGIVDVGANSMINLHAKVISINATEAIDLRGPIHIGNNMKDDDDQGTNTFTGNVQIGHNLHVGGGAFINGELFCSHITCQKQPMLTEQGGDSTGFISPYQTFVPFQGKSVVAPTLDCWSPLNQIWRGLNTVLPNYPGLIDIVIALPLPAPFDNIITVPARIGFPRGISFISDSLALQSPPTISEVVKKSIDKTVTPVDAASAAKTDFFGPPHIHEYNGLPITLVDSIDELWEAASQVDGNTRAGASAAQFNGMTPEQFKNKMLQMQVNMGKDWLWDQLKRLNPFASATNGQ